MYIYIYVYVFPYMYICVYICINFALAHNAILCGGVLVTFGGSAATAKLPALSARSPARPPAVRPTARPPSCPPDCPLAQPHRQVRFVYIHRYIHICL